LLTFGADLVEQGRSGDSNENASHDVRLCI
jgi:hypothetical protein